MCILYTNFNKMFSSKISKSFKIRKVLQPHINYLKFNSKIDMVSYDWLDLFYNKNYFKI